MHKATFLACPSSLAKNKSLFVSCTSTFQYFLFFYIMHIWWKNQASEISYLFRTVWLKLKRFRPDQVLMSDIYFKKYAAINSIIIWISLCACFKYMGTFSYSFLLHEISNSRFHYQTFWMSIKNPAYNEWPVFKILHRNYSSIVWS